MDIDALIGLANGLILSQTEKPLTDIQSAVLRGALQRQTYWQIADSFPCNESHAKDVGSFLWRQLSSALAVKVGKDNVRSVLEQHLHIKEKTFENLSTPNVSLSQNEATVSDSLNLQKKHDEFSYFVGREDAISDLNALVTQGRKVIVIQATGGVGKTTLAKQYLKQFEILPLDMAKETENITAVESVVEEWLKRYFQEEPGRELGIMLGRLKQQLQNRKVGILIDNLEPALDSQGKFIKSHIHYVDLLRVLADSTVKSVTFITSREKLCDGEINGIYHYYLNALNLEAWKNFFEFHQIDIHVSSLKEMHAKYVGNAKAMDILLGAIQTDCEGDMSVYWQYNSTLVETALKNLIESQFNRLQRLDSTAYKLLCRLGCYRYQNIPYLSRDALLALLWDTPNEQQRMYVIKSLQDRRLIEFRIELGTIYYWLHPVIKEECVERLKATNEWEEVNRKAAEFWRSSVKTIETKEDANKALEAYHHYVSISDFEKAGFIIIERRDSRWGYDEHLGRSLYRLGLLTPLVSAINLLIEINITSKYLLASIYNIGGSINWILGNIHEAVKHHNKSLELVNCISHDYENNKIDINSDEIELLRVKARFNAIYSCIGIGELKNTLDNLENLEKWMESIITKNQKSYLTNYIVCIWFSLASLYSCFNSQEKAFLYAEKVYVTLDKTPASSWSRGYTFLHLGLAYKNLEAIAKSFEMYNRAIEYAEQSQYIQVKALALTGLAELYRIQDNVEESISCHSKSIEILEKINTKCDLAEAYFQLGLTYQKIGNSENSQINFDKAIQLFTVIEAPKQIEKVKKASEDFRVYPPSK